MASQPFCRRKGACLLLAERSIRQACCSIVLHGRPCHLCCTICKAGAACVAHCRQKASLKSRHSRAAMPLTVQGWWRSWPGTGPVSTESPPAAALSATAAARAAAAAAGGRVPPPCRPAAAPAAGRQQWTGQWAATLPPPTAAGVAVGNVLPGVNINLAGAVPVGASCIIGKLWVDLCLHTIMSGQVGAAAPCWHAKGA